MGIKREAMSEDTEERITPREGGTAPTMNLPSVTECLKPFMDFSKVPLDVLAAAAARGTEVHSICACISKKLWVFNIPEFCTGYVNSFRGWLDSMVEEVVLAEERLYDRSLGFHGMPDLICRIKGDLGLTLVDLKTGKVVQSSWEVQIAAYRHLAIKAGYPVHRILSLRLSADGKPPIINESTKGMDQLFNVFVSALNCYRHFYGGK